MGLWTRARLRSFAGQAVVPQSDGVTEPGVSPLQASTRDDHGPLCRNRRVIGMLERVRCGCERQDRSGGQGRDPAGSADRILWFARGYGCADRAGGWAIVAMALRSDAASGS